MSRANTEMFLSLVSIPGRYSPAVPVSWGALMATSHFVLNVVVPKFNFPSCNIFQWEHCSRAIVSKKVGGTTEKIPLSNSTSCSQKRCPSVLAKLIQSASWWGLNHKIRLFLSIYVSLIFCLDPFLKERPLSPVPLQAQYWGYSVEVWSCQWMPLSTLVQ